MNTVREFTKDILQSIREKYREGSLHTQCFAKMLLDFGLEEGLTEEELLSEILLFMVAGHETTAHSLAWIIYAMVKDEALQTRCHDELTALHKTTTTKGKKATDKSFPSTSPSPYATRSKRKSKSEDSPSVQELDEQIGERDGDKLLKSSSTEESTTSLSLLPPYLEAVVKESMRKYPAASRGSMRLVRASEDGITIPLRTLHNNPFVHYNYPDDIHLPKGTWILMNIFALHNWEGNWGDDVNEFKPERFLPSNQEEKEGEGHEGGSTVGNTILASPAAYHGGGYANQQLIFAPFSYGARNCLGMNIAIWEIRSVVSRLLRDYRFEIAEPDLVDEHIALKTDITMKPLHQLPVYVYSR